MLTSPTLSDGTRLSVEQVSECIPCLSLRDAQEQHVGSEQHIETRPVWTSVAAVRPGQTEAARGRCPIPSTKLCMSREDTACAALHWVLLGSVREADPWQPR